MQEFTHEIKNFINDMLKNVHTMLLAKIETFNPETCLASVTPYAKYRKKDGTLIDFPVISQVPVYVMQANNQSATIAMPIKKDDKCLLLFSEQALDVWRSNGEIADADLSFDLTNAIAIVGMFAKPNSLVTEACEDNAIIIQSDGGKIKVNEDGTQITASGEINIIANGPVNLSSAGEVTVKGSRVSIN